MSNLVKVLVAIGIVVAAIVGAVILASMGKEPTVREPVTAALLVDVVRPEVKQGAFSIRAQGTVMPRNQTTLVTEVSGKVEWVSEQFVAGGVFEAGEELVRIDPSDYQTALLAAEADLASALATLADEQARSDAARDDFRRLYGDRQPSDLALRLPQVARAQAAVQAQEAAVARARRNLERTRLSLPFDGMVTERGVNLGQYVAIGTSMGSAFGTERAEVRLPMSDNDLAFLGIIPGQAGQDLDREIELAATVSGQKSQWTARLVRTEGVFDRNTRLTYLVGEIHDPYSLSARNQQRPLPVGTFVEAAIPGRDASGLVLLPSQAIHDGNQVYLAGPDDRLQVISVEIVRSTPREVYVRSELAADARVITTAIPAPVPGLRLNVREADAEAEPRLRILPPDGELAATGERG